eukprot:s14599_g1.t1
MPARMRCAKRKQASAPLSSFRSSLPVSGTDMPMRSEALSSQAFRRRTEALELAELCKWKVACCEGRCELEQLGSAASPSREVAISDLKVARSDRSHSASTRVATQQLGEASAPLSSFRSSLPVSGTDMPMRSEALSSQAARQHTEVQLLNPS